MSYVVRAGDTPRRIAASLGVSYSSLAAANPQWIEGEPLIEGELLQVPVRLPRRYSVLGGDTWESIAVKAGCPAARLREINGSIQGEQLEEGQVIELPAPGSDRIVKAGAEYGSAQLARDIERLKKEYPFLTEAVIGRSVMGKPIHALRLGEGAFRLHANGTVHANEWITALALMRFVEEYARACKWHGSIGGRSAAALYRRCTLWVVPMANPDGADLSQAGLKPDHPFYKDLLRWNKGSRRFDRWKANIRGVDLNDQFPAFWEEERKRRGRGGPGPRDYSGPAPLSEPEAQALAGFARETDFHAALSFHTQGEEIYWNYRGLEPESSERRASRLAAASGYRPVKLEGSDAGFKDWFIAEFRRPGFTAEMGWGRNPLPLRVFPDVYDDTLAILTEAMEFAE
ncbi:LysM peptidoglycan-binding domain-containing protein [Cohnella sp. CBP 2801]|uniref:LysM peptidoglycan-binding domain-containing protein n=2 Tax=Cohnella zeiphila TaxID=2761120 RepID=A0A7X0STW4_9BACL|nr:M14 family zinc carboxypeptidase [Cohnella zeiphila]MBB6735044.1 LysM peptidoglycan-binding domain-containing protein [Cohnella zeiphila]